MNANQPTRVRFGGFELDLRTGELLGNDRKVVLQEQPFRVLVMLVERAGQIASRDEIQKQLWPNDTGSALGETDAAFEWFETAVRQRDTWLSFLRADPGSDPLRGQSRFTHLLRQVGLDH
jgi:hypothetical protein